MLQTLAVAGVIILASLSGRTAPSPHEDASQRPSVNRGQTITGRVTDSAGRGVEGVFVSPMRDSDEAGAPHLRPVDVRLYSVTNAHGEFRLQNLPPDAYCLVAFPRNAPVTADHRPNRDGYAITYYPNTPRAADAKAVMVTRDKGALANITLAPARLANIAGSATDSRGQPARGSPLLLAHGDGLFGLASTTTSTAPDGTFTIGGLPPGTYFLHMREGAWPPPRDVIPKVSVATVIVDGHDVNDVHVRPFPMVRATGRVVIDPSLRSALPAALRIGTSPLDFQGNPGPDRPGTLRSDLTFELHTWPRRGYVVVATKSEWSVGRVRLNGIDVTRTGIDFGAGREFSGLEIELTRARPR